MFPHGLPGARLIPLPDGPDNLAVFSQNPLPPEGTGGSEAVAVQGLHSLGHYGRKPFVHPDQNFVMSGGDDDSVEDIVPLRPLSARIRAVGRKNLLTPHSSILSRSPSVRLTAANPAAGLSIMILTWKTLGTRSAGHVE